jgi:type I restriction enzyme R subunit
MTTKLAGPATYFLPFNLGDDGAAGNPVNPNGHRTAYLVGRRSGQRDSWLEILGRYLVAQARHKKQITGDHLSPLPPARRTRKADSSGAGRRGGRKNT